MNNLAMGYQAAGQMNRALPLLEETFKVRKARLGADHPDTLVSRHNLMAGYFAAGMLAQALPFLQEDAAGVERRQFRDQNAAQIVQLLIRCHEQLKQFDQAETWRRKWLAVLKERSGPESLPYSIELSALGTTLLEQKKWSDAEAVLHECLAIREKKEPDEWRVCNTRSMLGAALLGQNKHADAEPLLLKGYEGMKQRAAGIPGPIRKARLTEAVERLIALYEATGQSDEAARWRKELP
jgi:tetratricopeptide (TPR) repeat protein